MPLLASRADLPGAVEEVTGGNRELFAWVVREGVTNVLRHSNATRCRVRVTPTSVEVADDGRGGGATAGNGLSGLRERAGADGAVLEVESVSGGGFVLRVRTPTPATSAAGPGSIRPPAARSDPAGSPARPSVGSGLANR